MVWVWSGISDKTGDSDDTGELGDFCESGESCEFGEFGDTCDAGDTGDAGRFLLIWWGCCYIKMIDSGKFGKWGNFPLGEPVGFVESG